MVRPLPPITESNGAWIVPVVGPDGRPKEPMVLVPVKPALSKAVTTVVGGELSTNTARSLVPATIAVVSNTPPPVRPPVKVLSPAAIASTNVVGRAKNPFDERILAAQVALARLGISSGSFDGVAGSQTRAAVRVFQEREGLPASGTLGTATLSALANDEPLYTNFLVSAADLASLQPLGTTWLGKSQQSSLAHENLLELVAERTHSNPKLVRWLNPEMDWDRVEAGTSLKVLNLGPAPAPQKAAFLRIHLADRKLNAYDEATNLLVHFPCSIAARVDKRPLGEELHISVMAPNPNYTFDPAVFPESAEARELDRKLILQPGPNNPVGTVWLGLDKPGYGIHGTPKPEDVGRTESHGCFRLANWNAERLLKMVNVGTPVFVEP
jgi:lipoprotein-anchoring transpeptidase ErfK/SrfK